MKTIWKFPLAVGAEIALEMPGGATVLDVQTQGEIPCVWALVDSTAPLTKRHFCVMGTGHNCDTLPANAKHVGSFQLLGGALVFHLFDAGETP
jgi:hypothetical protein